LQDGLAIETSSWEAGNNRIEKAVGRWVTIEANQEFGRRGTIEAKQAVGRWVTIEAKQAVR